VPEIIGSGSRFSQMFRAREGSKVYYRLQVLNTNVPPLLAPATANELFATSNLVQILLAGVGDPIQLRFPSEGQYSLFQGGATQLGAVSGAVRTENAWAMNLSPAAGQQGAQPGVLRLDFTATNNGTLTYRVEDTVQSGTFQMLKEAPEAPPGPGGFFPEKPWPKVLQLNYAGGGSDKFTFTGTTMVLREDGEQSGTYTYDMEQQSASVVLENGWRYEITLNQTGSATVVFREEPNTNPITKTGSYTLQ